MATEKNTAAKTATKSTAKKTTEAKARPLNDKIYERVKPYLNKAKDYLKDNYKTPKFIAICAGFALLALICTLHCFGEQSKLHFSKFAIVKEVMNGSESTYYLCKRDFPEGEVKPNTYYISCNTKIVENK